MENSGLRSSDQRLLRGYGPAVVLAAAFLLMALLVPTVAPERDVAISGYSNPTQSGGLSAGASPAPGAAGSGGGGGAGSATASATPAGSRTASGPTGSGGPVPPGGPKGSSGLASGAAGAGGVSAAKACAGNQVPNDTYSPPCISFSGNNGGASYRGVTANTITISFRISSDNVVGVSSLISKIATRNTNTQFNESTAQVERTVSDLVAYFNDHFQFYGRKLVLKFWNGQGQLLQEFQDAGQAQAQADALNEANSIKPFAEIFALSQPFSEALSAQGIVNLGSPYMSQEFYQQHAPYAYSVFPDATDLGVEGGNLAVKELCHQPVTWAGTGVSDGQKRKFAVLVPDNPVYQQAAKEAISVATAAGCAPAANLTYALDLSQASQEAQGIAQQIVNDKITTILEASDPIAPIFLTGDLDNAHYEPEIFNLGAAFTDYDYVAQLFDQSVWSHDAGVTNGGPIPPYGSSIAYFAAKSVDPGNPPALEVDNYYEDLYMLALGIQMAGPDLTPQTFERGLFDYRGGNGIYGPWTFDVGGVQQFTPQHQFEFEYWDPNAVSKFNGSKGTYVVDPTWYTVATAPSGKPPVAPPSGPAASTTAQATVAERRDWS